MYGVCRRYRGNSTDSRVESGLGRGNMDSCGRSSDSHRVGSGGGHRGLVRRTTDSSPGELNEDGGDDRGWMCWVDIQTSVPVGWVVSVKVVVTTD